MPNNPLNNIPEILQRFQQFKQTFSGNPKEKVMQLLNSGQMSQAQFNQLQAMAKQFQNILH